MPSVFTLGKGFAECSTRQSPLGKFFLGKGSLPSAFYRGTRQNKKQFYRVLGAALGKIFSAVVVPAVSGYFAECPTQHSAKKKFIFFKNYFAECPSLGTRQSFLIIFLKITLPSAPIKALGKFFFIFFKSYFAECPSPGTRQSFFLKKITLPSAPAQTLGKVFFIFLK